MARPFDQYNPDRDFAWVDKLDASTNAPPERKSYPWDMEPAFQTQDVNLRNHTYEIREVVERDVFIRLGEAEVEKMVMARMASAIGHAILKKVARIERMDLHMERKVCISAEFVALPPDKFPRDTYRGPQDLRIDAPKQQSVREVIKEVKQKVLPVEYANDELVEVWQIAYDMATSNPDDDVAPEKRALDAVLDYMREKI